MFLRWLLWDPKDIFTRDLLIASLSDNCLAERPMSAWGMFERIMEIPVQHYKSVRVAVMICTTRVNTQTHTDRLQTHTETDVF